jgi:RNA polymerase sigma-70 factor (ECF subfamily)
LAHAHCDQHVTDDSSEETCSPRDFYDIGEGDTWQHWEIADQTKSVEELYTGQERVERLKRAICRLHPTLRNVVEIHQSENCSVKGSR